MRKAQREYRAANAHYKSTLAKIRMALKDEGIDPDAERTEEEYEAFLDAEEKHSIALGFDAAWKKRTEAERAMVKAELNRLKKRFPQHAKMLDSLWEAERSGHWQQLVRIASLESA